MYWSKIFLNLEQGITTHNHANYNLWGFDIIKSVGKFVVLFSSKYYLAPSMLEIRRMLLHREQNCCVKFEGAPVMIRTFRFSRPFISLGLIRTCWGENGKGLRGGFNFWMFIKNLNHNKLLWSVYCNESLFWKQSSLYIKNHTGETGNTKSNSSLDIGRLYISWIVDETKKP